MLIAVDRREGLRPYVGERITVIGKLVRYARNKETGMPTTYIEDIHLAKRPERKWLCQHVWLDGRAFIKAGVGEGDWVKFRCIPHRKRNRYYISWGYRVRGCRQ